MVGRSAQMIDTLQVKRVSSVASIRPIAANIHSQIPKPNQRHPVTQSSFPSDNNPPGSEDPKATCLTPVDGIRTPKAYASLRSNSASLPMSQKAVSGAGKSTLRATSDSKVSASSTEDKTGESTVSPNVDKVASPGVENKPFGNHSEPEASGIRRGVRGGRRGRAHWFRGRRGRGGRGGVAIHPA